MSKLFTLKDWYRLEDAAKRLRTTLNEDVSIEDLLQLAIENRLPLSWYARHVPFQQMILQTKIYRKSESPEFMKDLFPEDCEVFYREVYMPEGEVVHLTGQFKLIFEECGALQDWVHSFLTHTGGELITLDGFLVEDENGFIWRRQEYISNSSGLRNLGKNGQYIPSGEFPPLSELVINHKHLEEFEKELTKPQKSSTAITKERETLMRMVAGMAMAWYGYNPNAKKNESITEITNDLARVGVKISPHTVRKWLRKGNELLPQDEGELLE
ncbi:MAG: hypothetical protein GVX96_03675 [Bacteroidetes bacterium]|jgi:hypothetical protein|nr:hypothetical protein [Bacteroidota bacterium]